MSKRLQIPTRLMPSELIKKLRKARKDPNLMFYCEDTKQWFYATRVTRLTKLDEHYAVVIIRRNQ